MIQERLKSAQMQERGIDIYIVPTSDFHQSEYVGEYFKARKYMTGFTGSAGTAVITKRRGRTVDRRTLFYPGRKTVRRQYRQAL